MKFLKNLNRIKIFEKVPFDEVPQKPGQVHISRISGLDVSCASDGSSSNDCLYSGPDLLSKIFETLLRFRFNFIGILANIKHF